MEKLKNILVLPTDKPTKLHYYNGLFLSPNFQLSTSINSVVQGKNIYITSDEEIKEGWCIQLETNEIFKVKEILEPQHLYLDTNNKKHYDNFDPWSVKKIILTTDQDLIKDVVQAIDNNFLEWFVKNPSCEFVDVENSGPGFPAGIYFINYLPEHFEKIIIPKEELKQETLEETAEKYGWKIKINIFSDPVKADELANSAKQDFIKGAKWQAEGMYTEQEVLDIISKAVDKLQFYFPDNMKDQIVGELFNEFKKK